MANSIKYKDKVLKIGDTITINYKIKEGDKERIQAFSGILIKIKGNSDQTRMITVRKISKSGIGVERIIPLLSPYIESIKLVKKSSYEKAKAYFIRNLSDKQLRAKLYKTKTK
ncbi:MAG: 50S ribosomal protein L19 [Microgenomates group bacterium]